MNLLLDKLLCTVEVKGKQYAVRTDFRIWIQFELLMDDVEIPDEDKPALSLNLCFPDIPADRNAAIDQMLWFYRCGQENKPKDSANKKSHEKQIYSYDYDDAYIYAAFLSQYNIDLQDIPKLHWWKFRAMFRALKDDNLFVKIMGYRAAESNKNMSEAQKTHLREMKAIYALPLPKNEKQKISAIELALMGNGDLSGIIN